MKKGYWIAGGLALVAVIIAARLLLPSGGQESMATVIETVNQVDAHPRPKDDWRPAVVDMLIYGGGQVRTGAASSARLELLEGMVRLSADSIFTLKESATRQGTLMTTVFLQEGRLWADLITDQPHEFSVETGSAVAAVRDTRFSVRVAAGETLLSVAQGQATLTAQEQSVTVAEGQQATVEAGQPPSPPEPMSDEERSLWATEGEMPELAPPTPTPVPPPAPTPPLLPTLTPTLSPTPTTAPTDTPTPLPTPVPPTATPMPTPTVPAEVQVDADDDGSQIELAGGQILVVTLGANPSTGYTWEVLEIDPAVLQQVGEAEFQSEEVSEGFVGAGGRMTFRFKAASAGQTSFRMIYRRPWEAAEDSVFYYSLQVVVR